MSEHWIMDELLAKIRLRDLEAMTDGAALDPVRCEVAKAVTVAQSVSNIETRVVCKTRDQAIQAIAMLVAFARHEGLPPFDAKKLCLELGNGSGVVVKMQE